MTKQTKATSTKNTAAPANPESPPEMLATEGTGVSSQATTQAETGDNRPPEAVNTPAAGEGGSSRDEAHGAALEPVLAMPDDSADRSAAVDSLWQPTHIVVRSLKDGFRRAGRAWSKEPTTVPIDDFTPEEIKALVDEPMLAIELAVE